MTLKKLIPLLVLLLAIDPCHAQITGWNNSYTMDNSTQLPIPANTTIIFDITLNQSANVTLVRERKPDLSSTKM